MQFSVVTLFALITAVVASPQARAVYPRQDSRVDTEIPSMTDGKGNVIPFDTKGVTKAN